MKVSRVLFQFNDRCPNKCPFCYMPFDRKGVGNVELWIKIVNRLKDFQVDLLSLAGGDPLCYNEFYDFVKQIDKSFYINLVTSGRFLDERKYSEISSKIDSIGLPIDDVINMKKRQRFSTNQFEEFENNLKYFIKYNKNITINTLVTPINKGYLEEIGDYLIKKGLKIWNLFQYWDFEFMENQEKFQLDDKEFINELNILKDKFGNKIDVNGWTYKERVKGYFFVTSLGEVYTIHKDNPHRYAFIGSIFDSDIYDKWLIHNTSEESQQRFHIIADREIIDTKKFK